MAKKAQSVFVGDRHILVASLISNWLMSVWGEGSRICSVMVSG